MHIITVATHNEGYFDILKKSCKRNKIDLKVLGWGQGKTWNGNITKFKYLIDYLNKLDPNEIIVIVDAFDVMLLSRKDEIEKKFRESGKKFICGAEKIPDFVKSFYEERFHKNNFKIIKTLWNYDYLCSGTIISYAGYAKKIFEKCWREYKNEESDQVALTQIYHTTDLINIDWKNELFYTCTKFGDKIPYPSNYQNLKFFNNRIYNSETKTFPCFVHLTANGDLCKYFAKELGYKCTSNKFTPIYGAKKYYYHLKHNKSIMISIYIILVLLFISIIILFTYGIKKIKIKK